MFFPCQTALKYIITLKYFVLKPYNTDFSFRKIPTWRQCNFIYVKKIRSRPKNLFEIMRNLTSENSRRRLYVSLRKSPTDTMKMLQTTENHRSVSYYLVHSSCATVDFQLLRSPPMMINGRSPVWHARRMKLLHMFNRWSNNFARIGTAYLHLTAGYTDIKC